MSCSSVNFSPHVAGFNSSFAVFGEFAQLAVTLRMTGRPLRLGSDGQALTTRPGNSASTAFKASLRRLRVRSTITPNKSFKPNLLRYGNGVAEEACHAVASTAQVGLTQQLSCDVIFQAAITSPS